MPTCHADNIIDFTNYLSKIHSIIDDNENAEAIIMGDYNAHPTSIFGLELRTFCNNNNYICLDMQNLPPDSYTFVSDAHNTTKWLDHCMITENLKDKVTKLQIHYDISWTDHRAMSCEVEMKHLCPVIIHQEKVDSVKWSESNT
jgi:exonuclease III